MTPSQAPALTADQPARQGQTKDETPAPLFAADAAASFRSRWQDIQTSFIDEPSRAVEQADSLVAEIMQQLAKTFVDLMGEGVVLTDSAGIFLTVSA